MLNKQISELINYSIEHNFLPENQKEQLLHSEFNKKHNLISKITNDKTNDYLRTWKETLEFFNFNNTLEEDIFSDELASLLIGTPEWINAKFNEVSNKNVAMDWYEDFSKFTTYIKVERIKKNVLIQESSSDIVVALNKSKPEKTQAQIVEAAKVKNKLSILSIKQVGLKGSISQAPRMAHRVIDMPNNDKWFIQYSPYQYLKGHSIVISKVEKPMSVDNSAIKFMLEFTDVFNEFNISLNGDLPIVGGSILKHMHFQAGKYNFPIYKAKREVLASDIYQVDWPITTLLVQSHSKANAISKATKIVESWKSFSSSLYPEVFNNSNNTCSLSARLIDGEYQIFVILRNAATNNEFPTGIFHVSKERQIIKQENIGIIEACGLGIFPGRLDFKIVDFDNQDVLNWKEDMGGFSGKDEYYQKILDTYKLILEDCNPFKGKYNEVMNDFIKEIN